MKASIILMLRSIVFLTVTASLVARGDTKNENATAMELAGNGILSTSLKFIKAFYLVPPSTNVIFSPLNVYAAMGLCHLSAAGSTREELAQFLGLPDNETRVLQVFEGLKNTIKSVQNLHEATASFANGMFIQKLTPIKQSFLGHLKNFYDSDIINVDFENEKSAATDYINKWISEKTKDRIPRLFEQPLSRSTRILIASSLFFSAKWAHPFPEHLTQTEKFNTGQENVDVKMMRNKKKIPYVFNENRNYEAVVLPYEGGEFFMYVLLPRANQTLKNLTEHLTVEDLQALFEETSKSASIVDYKIPYLKFRQSESIVEELKKFGVQKLFENADLGNLVSSTDLRITEITQAAEIESDERGTVANAVTALQFESYSGIVLLEEPIQFYVNKPFMFIICHNETSAPILTGLVHNPAA